MSDHSRSHVLASGFLALLASQIGTRLVTFTINLLIARHLTPEAYGLSSVQFHLLTTTALFISREGLRRGCLRFGGGGGGGDGGGKGHANGSSGGSSGSSGSGVDAVSVLRVAGLVVPVGALVTAGVCGVALWQHGRGGGGADVAVPYYREAVLLHGVAALLELLAEPFYILSSVHLMFGARVAIEFASTLAKSLVTLGLLLLPPRLGAPPPPSALLFSAAQLALAGVVLCGYAAVGMRLLAKDRQQRRRQRLGEGQAATGAEALPSSKEDQDGVAAATASTGGGGSSGGSGLRRRTGASHAGVSGDGPASGDGGGDGGRSGGGGPDDSGGGDGGQTRRVWLGPWTPLERRVLGTSALFTLQAVEKLALAEGSKLVLATLQSAVNQGVYGLVSNLGSLVVRTLFQPLEEAAFAAFSAWGAEAAAAPPPAAGAAAAKAAPALPDQGQEGREARREEGDAARARAAAERLAPLAAALGPMVKAVALLGLAAAAFGPPYSYTLLRAVYGVRWSESEAPAVLAVYSVYVLLLALNGIGEAFVHAVLDAAGLRSANAALLGFSAAHLAACLALVQRWGAVGLVAADSANMALRIAYSAWCISRFFRPLPSFSLVRDLLPAPGSLAAFAAAGAAAAASQRALLAAPGTDGGTPQRVFLRRAGAHVGVGMLLLAALVCVLARTERAALRQVVEMRRRGRRQRGPPPPASQQGWERGGGGGGAAEGGRGAVKED